MSFETSLQKLADGAALKVAELTHRHAILKFNMSSGRVQTVWVLPFDDVWEFSAQSMLEYDSVDDFPLWILQTVLAKNSKNKRAFWCLEELRGKHILSAMVNFPNAALTAAEFDRICRALAQEVDNFEQIIFKALSRVK